MNNHHLISANRLDDGAVVWLDRSHEWVAALEQACVFDDERIERAKLSADRAVAANLVVAPTPRAAQLVMTGSRQPTYRPMPTWWPSASSRRRPVAPSNWRRTFAAAASEPSPAASFPP